MNTGIVKFFNTTVYEVRPDVCRACVPGDDACETARAKFGF